MAAPRVFEGVSVNILHEDGSKTEKYDGLVSVRVEYDPHGLSCKVCKGKLYQLIELNLKDILHCLINNGMVMCKLSYASLLFGFPTYSQSIFCWFIN